MHPKTFWEILAEQDEAMRDMAPHEVWAYLRGEDLEAVENMTPEQRAVYDLARADQSAAEVRDAEEAAAWAREQRHRKN